nr:bifunctional 3-(3-hydroxy-phenyl)propionate/3-hydroxycinnamic acid hydroxylase [Ruegeria halocynthiae]
MTQVLRHQVAIIGAGPTGLATAAILGRAGVSTIVLERRTEPFTVPRAIAFDPETLRLFQKVGALEALKPSLIEDLVVEYTGRFGQLLARVEPTDPHLGHSDRGSFYQPELEDALIRTVVELPSVTVERGVTVGDVVQTGDGVRIIAQNTQGERLEYQVDYTVACDGGSSKTRELLGIRFSGFSFEERWIVVDLENDHDPDRSIKFFCEPERPSLTLPVSKNRRRWEFLVMPGDDVDEIVREPNIRKMLAERGVAEDIVIDRCVVYSFHSRFAEHFRKGRIFLAGDAAHVMPPFAGQGLNSGLRDAANIGWKLACVCKRQCAPDLLDTYEAERRKSVADMTRLALLLGRTVMPTSPGLAWLRDKVLGGLWALYPWRKFLNSGALVPDPSIGKTPLARRQRKSVAGTMIPQPGIDTSAGTVPLDDLLGDGFAAIGVDCDPADELTPGDLKALKHLGTKFVSIGGDSEFRDTSGALSKVVRGQPSVIILRPDRFIADILEAGHRSPKLNWFKAAYAILTSEKPSAKITRLDAA